MHPQKILEGVQPFPRKDVQKKQESAWSEPEKSSSGAGYGLLSCVEVERKQMYVVESAAVRGTCWPLQFITLRNKITVKVEGS